MTDASETVLVIAGNYQQYRDFLRGREGDGDRYVFATLRSVQSVVADRLEWVGTHWEQPVELVRKAETRVDMR